MSAPSKEQIIAAIQAALPGAEVTLVDLTGTANHWQATVISVHFEGKSLIERHRAVYDALDGHVGSGIHALSIIAKTP